MAEPDKAFKGGLRGLKGLAKQKESLPSETSQERNIPTESSAAGERIYLKDDNPMVDQYIEMKMPLSEEDVQHVMGSMKIEFTMLSLIFQGFLQTKLFFLFDYDEGNMLTEMVLDSVQAGAKEAKKLIDEGSRATGSRMRQILQGTFEGDDNFHEIQYFIIPLEPMQGLEEQLPVYCICDLKKKQTFFVSLNPEYNESKMRNDVSYQYFSDMVLKSIQFAVYENLAISRKEDSIQSPAMSEDFLVFLNESCEDPHMRYLVITYLIFYENATNSTGSYNPRSRHGWI